MFEIREARRFHLVKIAFEKVLAQRDLSPGSVVSPKNIAWLVTTLADAELAEMEKKPLDLATVESTATLAAVRGELQDHVNSELRRYDSDPTTDPYVLAYRDGGKGAYTVALDYIDKAVGKAMAEKEPETEPDTNERNDDD